MSLWVFSGDSEFVSTAMDHRVLGHTNELDVPQGDHLVIYRTDEGTVTGPFIADRSTPIEADPFDGSYPFLIGFEPAEEVRSAEIDSQPIRDELADGGSLDEIYQEIVRKRLSKGDEIDISSDDENHGDVTEDEPSLTLLDISQSAEPIQAAKQDFSGEEHGRLQLEGARLRGADLSHTDLEGTNLRGAELRNADLRGARLVDMDLSGARLDGADLTGANLTGAILSGDLRDCRFDGAVLDGADMRDATMRGAEFRGVQMRNADLRGTDPEGARFVDADLSGIETRDGDIFDGAVFRDSDLSGVTFAAIELRQAEFDGSDLRGADLTRPHLDETSFVGSGLTDADFSGQQASGLDLSEANLSGADLREVVLEDARFAGARLDGTRFHDADIQGAVLSDAQASGAEFDRANLERVSFSQAELFGARFPDAALYGAILQSARIGANTRFHHGSQDDDGHVIYDPRVDRPEPDGVVDEPTSLEKAMSVYRTLETVMEENAYGDRAAGYFLNRKALERRYHRRERNLGNALWNHAAWLSSGYGESFLFLFGWATLLIVLIGVTYPLLGLSHTELGAISYGDTGLEAALYGILLGLSTFTGLGYGGFQLDRWGEVLATISTAGGVLFFALFVFVLTRRAGR